MTFKAKSARSTATPVLKLGGQYVNSVDQYKYLWQTPYGLHMSFRDLPFLLRTSNVKQASLTLRNLLFAENQKRKVTLSHSERSLIY